MFSVLCGGASSFNTLTSTNIPIAVDMAACRFIKVPVLAVIVGSILSNFVRLQLRSRRIDAGESSHHRDPAVSYIQSVIATHRRM